jgi:putative membrane protein insertion efficiency factor
VLRKTKLKMGIGMAAMALVLSPLALAAQTRVTLAVDAIHAYRTVASPMAARLGIRCRFQPTCSRYAEEAIKKYGVLDGSLKAGRRLLRCTPLTPMGTIDLP